MNTLSKPLSIAAVLLLSLTLAAQSAVPASPQKLDKRLAVIAAAADLHVEAALMNAALNRQTLRVNSPFEARWNAEGQVQVYLHYDRRDDVPSLRSLQDLGASDIKASPELGVVQAWVPAAALETAASLPGVLRASVPRYAVVKRAPASAPVAQTGSVDTEGDQILGAKSFRTATGITGQGITVGVISAGDSHISSSQSTGDLPANIWDDPKDKGGTGGFNPASSGDEGTAMMEIVYDIAPGVKQLGFCGPATSVDFITCLDDLNSNIGANIIVDDLAFPGGAMFTTDTFSGAVQSFAQNNPKIHLVTAGGNDGTGYWQGTWSTPTPVTVSQTVNGINYTQALNFGTNSAPNPDLSFTAPGGDAVDYIVEWDDPWNDSATTDDPNDYDVVLFNSSGKAIACNQGMNINPNNGSCTFPSPKQKLDSPGPTPVQGARWQNGSLDAAVHLEVFYKAGTPGDRIKVLVFDESSKQIVLSSSTTGSVYGQSALPYTAEISVGAIYAPDALSGLYDIEPYSSEGPVELGTTGQTFTHENKPDFVAPDCVSVTGAGGFSSPFCGTSAAAPHIAGLTALLMAGYPDSSPYTLMKEAATQPGSPDPNGVYGFGLPIMTNLLKKGIYPNPTARITQPLTGSSFTTGDKVSFSGTCSPNGASGGVSYGWNFGVGSGIAGSSSANPGVTFTKAGSYSVSLTCTDKGGTGTAKIGITITAPSSGGGGTDLLSLLALGMAAMRRRKPA